MAPRPHHLRLVESTSVEETAFHARLCECILHTATASSIAALWACKAEAEKLVREADAGRKARAKGKP